MNLHFTDIISYGERAILIRWPERIEKDLLLEIWACEKILSERLEEIQSIVAAMNSLMIVFDKKPPPIIEISNILMKLSSVHLTEHLPKPQHHVIPVCYDPSLGPDQKEVCDRLKISPDELIELHSSREYLNVMIGFLPGFPYLHGLPESLQLPRKSSPSIQVPAGSVAISNQFTCIYPQKSPGGWHVIGRTPQRIFDITREDSPCLIRRNDIVSFYAVSLEEYVG